jgi:hypothetical protein
MSRNIKRIIRINYKEILRKNLKTNANNFFKIIMLRMRVCLDNPKHANTNDCLVCKVT